MKIFYSGTGGGGHPEELLPVSNVMMSFHDVKKNLYGARKRFERIKEKRKQEAIKVKMANHDR